MQIQEALQQAKIKLLTAKQPSDSPSLDAEILLSLILKKDRTYLYTWPENELSSKKEKAFFLLLEKRKKGEPIAYLTQHREFWGLNFKVNEHTLIPRADSETLVETALVKIKPLLSPKVLDLGTGSGALICAIKSEIPHAIAVATDLQKEALAIANENAQTLQLDISFKQGSWFEPLKGDKFDLIVSNPPYIEETDPHLQQGDLRFEPLSALASGKTGLDDINIIAKTAKTHLNYQAWLILEHGYNQAEAVKNILKENGFQNIETIKDYHQHPRITLGQKLDG